MKEYYRIDEDGNITTVETRNFQDLQKAVGGYIEGVYPLKANGAVIPANTQVYANEEGILLGMRRNLKAEKLLGHGYLAGPVVIRATKRVKSIMEGVL